MRDSAGASDCQSDARRLDLGARGRRELLRAGLVHHALHEFAGVALGSDARLKVFLGIGPPLSALCLTEWIAAVDPQGHPLSLLGIFGPGRGSGD